MFKDKSHSAAATTRTTNPKVVTYGLGLAIAAALAAALALSAATAIINPSAAYADWPKSACYQTEAGPCVFVSCEDPEECKETFGTPSPNQAAKSLCEEPTGEKCKKGE
jgi:hypothetical protein